jgi:hypothetical protein
MRGNLKRRIAGFIFVVLVFSATHSPAAEFAGGTGELNDPYQIATAAQLISIGDDPNLLNKHFELVNDIDLDPNLPSGKVFTKAVIASYKWIHIEGPFYENTHFSGSLDGNGHSISNMIINGNAGNRTEYFGLIGYLDSDGIVKDIKLRDIKIFNVGRQVGGLVGWNEGKVLRCSVTGNVSGEGLIGGLVGNNGGDNVGSIIACSAFCNIQIVPAQFSGTAGGLVGRNAGYISNCFATGTVTGDIRLGGLVGNNFGGYISNCYAIGTVTGEEYVGGLIGVNYGNAVSQCYAACEIIAYSNDFVGGLIGISEGQTTGSFWDVQVSGQKISAGGIGLPSAKLQDSRTYLSAKWDMTGETSNGVADIWTITEPNTYPQLTRFTEQYTVTQLPGSGTSDDPYEIVTTVDLMAINDYDINAHYVLVADIDMSGMVWATAPILFFDGTFDGRGHTISNLNIKGSDYLGLFGKILTNGVVTNLTIQDAYIIGNKRVGILAGVSLGHITNCHVTGNVTGVSNVGDLASSAKVKFISDCTSDVALSGNEYVYNIANLVISN